MRHSNRETNPLGKARGPLAMCLALGLAAHGMSVTVGLPDVSVDEGVSLPHTVYTDLVITDATDIAAIQVAIQYPHGDITFGGTVEGLVSTDYEVLDTDHSMTSPLNTSVLKISIFSDPSNDLLGDLASTNGTLDNVVRIPWALQAGFASPDVATLDIVACEAVNHAGVTQSCTLQDGTISWTAGISSESPVTEVNSFSEWNAVQGFPNYLNEPFGSEFTPNPPFLAAQWVSGDLSLTSGASSLEEGYALWGSNQLRIPYVPDSVYRVDWTMAGYSDPVSTEFTNLPKVRLRIEESAHNALSMLEVISSDDDEYPSIAGLTGDGSSVVYHSFFEPSDMSARVSAGESADLWLLFECVDLDTRGAQMQTEGEVRLQDVTVTRYNRADLDNAFDVGGTLHFDVLDLTEGFASSPEWAQARVVNQATSAEYFAITRVGEDPDENGVFEVMQRGFHTGATHYEADSESLVVGTDFNGIAVGGVESLGFNPTFGMDVSALEISSEIHSGRLWRTEMEAGTPLGTDSTTVPTFQIRYGDRTQRFVSISLVQSQANRSSLSAGSNRPPEQDSRLYHNYFAYPDSADISELENLANPMNRMFSEVSITDFTTSEGGSIEIVGFRVESIPMSLLDTP